MERHAVAGHVLYGPVVVRLHYLFFEDRIAAAQNCEFRKYVFNATHARRQSHWLADVLPQMLDIHVGSSFFRAFRHRASAAFWIMGTALFYSIHIDGKDSAPHLLSQPQ